MQMFPRDEIWIRKVYEPEIMGGKLTRLFKPENRMYPNPKGFKIGEEIKIRVVEVPCHDNQECVPVLSKEYKKAFIKNLAVIDIDMLKKKDFLGASKDITDIASLRYHLGILYNRAPGSFKKITIIDIKYI